jgi:hypothetical protein
MKDNNCGNSNHAPFQVLEACDKETTPNGYHPFFPSLCILNDIRLSSHLFIGILDLYTLILMFVLMPDSCHPISAFIS